MITAWIGIIGTVVGAIIGGGLSWLNTRFQLKHQEERERKRLLLGKLEETHELLSQYKHSYTLVTSQHVRMQLTKQPMDLKELTPIPKEKLRMLIGFYAPELTELLKSLEQASNEYGDASADHFEAKEKSETERKKTLAGVFQKNNEIDTICDEIQNGLTMLSRKYL
jgi:hypothetical protein